MAIALETSVRTNLAALQSITKGLARTEERLASGKKINSIMDGPASFFSSRSLNDRASTLNSRLDGMSNAIQTFNAAQAGIDAIRSLIANARALANDAITKGSASDRRDLGEQFNVVLEQAFGIANDASFNGVNLLKGNQVMGIEFGDSNGDSFVNIIGLDIQGGGGNGVSSVTTAETLSVASAASTGSLSAVGAQAFVATAGSVSSTGSVAFVASQASQAVFAGTAFQISQGSVASVSQASAGSVASEAAQASVASFVGIQAAVSAGSTSSVASQSGIQSRAVAASVGSTASASVAFTQSYALTMQASTSDPSKTVGLRKHGVNTPGGQGDHHVDFGNEQNYINILREITKEIDVFDAALATQSARIATNLNIVQVREGFTESLINTLEAGADNLVLADMNREGANLITLQTRHALGIQALSISSSQTQQILNLLV